MSDKPRQRMRVIPLEGDRPITRATFADVAKAEWPDAKAAYLDACNHMNSLMGLLHKPGAVKVSGQVTGALHTAKQLRDDADRLILALDAIVRAGRSVQ